MILLIKILINTTIATKVYNKNPRDVKVSFIIHSGFPICSLCHTLYYSEVLIQAGDKPPGEPDQNL